jgi:hypothetical protein
MPAVTVANPQGVAKRVKCGFEAVKSLKEHLPQHHLPADAGQELREQKDRRGFEGA